MNIYDIAQLCNVSTATVSRVLNGSPNVSEATRNKVLDIINSSGYVPSSNARSLGSGTSSMIGIVCTNIADMFYAEAVSLIEKGLRDINYDCLLYCPKGSMQNQLNGVHMLAKQVEALVFISSVFSEPCKIEAREAFSNVPVFVINGSIPGDNVYQVVSDEMTVMSDVIAEMCSQGLSKTLYIYDSLSYSGKKKLAGYRLGLSNADLPFNPSLTLMVNRNLDDAQSTIEDYISSGIQFDSVIASEDMFAIAFQKAMGANNGSVPIISFNNSILSSCATPRLTSIDLMLDTMCSTTISMLYDLLRGKRIPNRVVIAPVIVERDTFKPKYHQNSR